MVFSLLNGDIWGVTLFFLYLLHWFASTLISFTCLVRPTCPDIRRDNTIKFLVHERAADIGGTVIFKGKQHEIETWARTTLQFRQDVLADVLHWLWVMTGTLAAISSIACMVNMTGAFQLVFLAVLFYSSIAELVITQTARFIEREYRKSARLGTFTVLTENETRTYAIIRATLGVGDKCSLQGLDWIGLNLLPPTPVFTCFQKLLGDLGSTGSTDVEPALDRFKDDCKSGGTLPPKDADLVERIRREVRAVVRKAARKELNNLNSTKEKDGQGNSAKP